MTDVFGRSVSIHPPVISYSSKVIVKSFRDVCNAAHGAQAGTFPTSTEDDSAIDSCQGEVFNALTHSRSSTEDTPSGSSASSMSMMGMSSSMRNFTPHLEQMSLSFSRRSSAFPMGQTRISSNSLLIMCSVIHCTFQQHTSGKPKKQRHANSWRPRACFEGQQRLFFFVVNNLVIRVFNGPVLSCGRRSAGIRVGGAGAAFRLLLLRTLIHLRRSFVPSFIQLFHS